MKDYIKKLPKEIQHLITYAGEIASRNNMPAYLVGGFVRDLILGLKNLDVDIVLEGDGIVFAEDFARGLKAKLIRHRRFGTATVILKPHLKIDISTARKEFYPKPAHLPVVSRGRLKDDLHRRDFSINSMAISITGEGFGELIDFFGGRDDLRNKKINVLHGLSFIDDPTRILRAVRFAQRYNFRIGAQTIKDLKEAVRLKMLDKVEPQRIRDELILILKERHPLKEIKSLKELTGFGFISRKIFLNKRILGLIALIEKEVDWFNKIHAQRRALDSWLIYFMGLTDSLNTKDISSLCRKFAFRRGEEKRMLAYKRINRQFILRLCRKIIKPSDIFSLLEPLSYEVIILLKAKYKNKNLHRNITQFFSDYNGLRIHVSGDDLRGLDLAPGPQYQKIFARVLKAKLNGLVKTKEEELDLVKKLIKAK